MTRKRQNTDNVDTPGPKTPRRRSGGGNPGSGSTSSSAAAGSDEAARAAAAMQKGSHLFPWMHDWVTCLDTLLETHGTPSNLLRSLLPDNAAKLEYAEIINKSYPHNANSLMTDWLALGRTSIPIWAASYEEMAGNSGHVLVERFKRLAVLILINGFETNPDIH